MHIQPITTRKKDYLDLLLLADEQESMIDRYLEDGDMYALFEGESPVTVAVVLPVSPGVLELKNIATSPALQGRGYAKAMITFLEQSYHGRYQTLIVGTGDVPSSAAFYTACGFTYSHRVPGFFTDNYDHPIIDDGILLTDMVYYAKPI